VPHLTEAELANGEEDETILVEVCTTPSCSSYRNLHGLTVA